MQFKNGTVDEAEIDLSGTRGSSVESILPLFRLVAFVDYRIISVCSVILIEWLLRVDYVHLVSLYYVA